MAKRKNGIVWGAEPVIEPSRTDLDPIAALAAGVLKRATNEAQAGDLGAAAWLAGDLAGMFCDVLGLDHLKVRNIASRWMQNPAGRIVIRIM